MSGSEKYSELRAALRLFALIFLLFIGIAGKAAEITLAEAIHKGFVKAILTGNPGDSSKVLLSSYYGPCLRLNLQSQAKTTLNLRIECGRFLATADTNEQRMMITHDEMITLRPAGKISMNLYAMCTQMHDHAPDKESLLVLGGLAEGNLLTVARFIGKNNFQSQAAQQAVWVITDDNEVGNIYSENTDEMNQLQKLICELTGKRRPVASHSIVYSSGMVSGEIVFENKHHETYSFVMMDEAGGRIGTFFENKTIDKPTVTTLTWRFRFKGFEKGVYYVKLIDSGNKVVVTRPVVIN